MPTYDSLEQTYGSQGANYIMSLIEGGPQYYQQLQSFAPEIYAQVNGGGGGGNQPPSGGNQGQNPSGNTNPGGNSPGGNGSGGNLVDTYREVYNRQASQQDPNHGVYAWGDDYNRTNQQAYNMFREVMGREPNAQEFSQALPYFHNQGSQGVITGRQYLNQVYQQEQQNPQNPNSPLNPNNPNNNLGQYTQPVQDLYQELLSRGATQDELQYFQGLLASGQTTPYQVRQFIQAQPEYQGIQDTKFRGELNSELGQYESDTFAKEKQGILSSYAQNNQGGTNASLDYALANTLGEMAKNRTSFLGNLSAQQYGGNKQAAMSDYQNYMNQFYGQQNQNRANQFQQQGELRGRLGDIQDYTRQSQDYANYAGQMRQNQPFNTRDYTNIGLSIFDSLAKMGGKSK